LTTAVGQTLAGRLAPANRFLPIPQKEAEWMVARCRPELFKEK
jgi:hypothetical protein